jgi:hypothetical protein
VLDFLVRIQAAKFVQLQTLGYAHKRYCFHRRHREQLVVRRDQILRHDDLITLQFLNGRVPFILVIVLVVRERKVVYELVLGAQGVVHTI